MSRIFLSMATHSCIVQELQGLAENGDGRGGARGFRATGSRLPLHAAATWRHCWVVRLQSQPRGDWCWGGDLVNPGLRQGCTDSEINTHFTCSLPYPPWAVITKYPRLGSGNLFSHCSEGCTSKIKVLSVLVSCISLPGLQRATFLLCLHMGFPVCIQERGGAGGDLMSPPSLLRTPVLLNWNSTIMTLIISLKDPSPNMLGVGAST